MNEDWHILPLATSPVNIIDGDRGAEYPKKSDFHSKGDWLFLDTSNVRADGFDFLRCQFILNAKEQRLRKGRVSRNDIVLTTRGTIGNVGFYSDRVPYPHVRINSGMVVLRADPNELLPEFLFQVVRSGNFRAQIKALTSGAAQPQLPIRDIKLIKIPIPPPLEQERIASILGAYDDLLEVNRRRIALLEEIAGSLFEEWFVRLRFPGHEERPVVDIAVGCLPKEWRQGSIGDLVELKTGFPFKSGTFSPDGQHRLVTIRNVQDGAFGPICESRIDDLPQNLPSHCRISDGDILMSLTGNVGRTSLVYDGPFLLNQRVALLAPVEPMDTMFVYCLFRQSSTRTKLELISNGVAQKNLSPIVAAKLPFVIPPHKLRTQFDSITRPLLAELVLLKNAEIRLAASRDLLLPRLLSGEVSVSAVARELETAA